MPTNPSNSSGRPTVYISYSHRDEVWKDRLVSHLKVLDIELEVWDAPRSATGGSDWLTEVLAAMNRAVVAILLVSNDFLASRFIQDQEVPYLLKRREEEDLRIIPLIVRPSPWMEMEWLAGLQVHPKTAKPLAKYRKPQAEQYLADLAHEVRSWLTAPTASPLSRGRAGGRGERGTGGEVQPRLNLGRLPIPGPHLIGREKELARLDAAWRDPETHVLTLVAFGGTGKSALVSRWLDLMAADHWRGARRVLDWSFYSQGTEDRVASADRFLDHALAWFGDPDPKAGAPRDRGLRLADLVRHERTLLVLDGIEALQHPPNHPLAGRLKDPGLAALLKGLAGANPGLCVVTSRERIGDLDGFFRLAPQEDLENLSPEAGAELLRKLGVKGRTRELLAASRELGNHVLTLSLLGAYLSRACGGDVRRRKEVNLRGADQGRGGHAFRVIGAYAKWFGDSPELATLRLLGLFDGPAQPGAIAALRANPVISGLTEPLMDLNGEAWQLALSHLREIGLLLPADPHQPDALDTHPLVRVYFQEELKTRPEAWKAGNLRLYEYFGEQAPSLPETLEEMEPLYAAVMHGCRAGRQQEVLDTVYRRRIQRGSEFYSSRQLGAFGVKLSALSGFFHRPWDQPSASLTSGDQAFVLNEAGFDLRALGRLPEAVAPMEAALKLRLESEDWKNAAIQASNLSELTLALGDVARAVSFGMQSIDLADRSGDAFERMYNRTVLADALHQSGRLEESAEAFSQARAFSLVSDREYSRVYWFPVYWYCDLLLSRGESEAYSDVLERAQHALRQSLGQGFIFAIALAHLSLGRVYLALGDLSNAADHLDQSVESLRRSGREDNISRGLLARAALRRLQKDWPAAEADLSEALEITERGSMRLHECDTHLEWARLCWDRGDRDGLQQHLARARKLVKETGYGRRRPEIEQLENPPTTQPVPAPSAPINQQPLKPEELLLLAFRLVATRRSTPDLLLHLDATRLREAADGVLAARELNMATHLRAAASLLADEAPALLPDPLWQSWMLATQAKVLQDLAAATASDLPG